MPPAGLLRASDFCRSWKSPRISVKFFHSDPPSASTTDNEDCCTSDAVVWASSELFIQLSCKTGDLVWLYSKEQRSNATDEPELRIPAILCIDSTLENPVDCIKLPPYMDYFCGDEEECWIQSASSLEDFETNISQVVVRPIGRPVPIDALRLEASLGVAVENGSTTSSDSKMNEYPDIGRQKRLIAPNVLVSVIQGDCVFVYQVLDTAPIGWTSSETQWKLLQQSSSNQYVPRLPPLLPTKLYLKEESCTVIPQFPHASLPEVQSLLNVPHDEPSDLVLHIVGTTQNHVRECVRHATAQQRRRYIAVRGLAAYAHLCGKTVTTGSAVDQLAGLACALEQASQQHAPCVLHLVDMDAELESSTNTNDEEMREMLEQRIWTMISSCLWKLDNTDSTSLRQHTVPPLVVVMSTRQALEPGPLLHNLTLSGNRVTLTKPDESYARYLWKDDATFRPHALHGKTAHEIVRLQRLWLCQSHYIGSSPHDVEEFILEESIDNSSSDSTSMIPRVHWEDVGGLSHVRHEIMDAIELPLKHAHLFQQSTSRSGLLLYGPPGTGKTLVAKAVATECRLPFLSVKGPELLGSYVGESEENVRNLFEKAREAASSSAKAAILFFDELDSLAPRRGGHGDGGGVMERVLATLLTELDKPSSVSSTIFLIAATNRPDLIDPSLLRPGRLDRRVYLGLPTATKDRAQILSALIRKFKLQDGQDAHELALQVVDEFPQNLSGADFSAISSGALRKSLKRLCEKADAQVTPERPLQVVLQDWGEDELVPVVTKIDLIEASKQISPSVTQEDLRRYQRLRDDYSSNSIQGTIATSVRNSSTSDSLPEPKTRTGSVDSLRSADSSVDSASRRTIFNSRQNNWLSGR